MPLILVTDFEATCWSSDTLPADAYRELIQKQEIIEIGCCYLAPKTLEVVHQTSIIIKPIFNPVLSPFCTELTGITQTMVENGAPFDVALNTWIKLAHKADDMFASWGAWDFHALHKNCNFFDIGYPFISRHINIKQLIADEAFDGRPAGIRRRLHELGLSFEGSQHRALDDAINIVNIIKEVCYRTGEGFDDILRRHGVRIAPF